MHSPMGKGKVGGRACGKNNGKYTINLIILQTEKKMRISNLTRHIPVVVQVWYRYYKSVIGQVMYEPEQV